MLNESLRKYLDKSEVNYSTISHPTAYTASQTAQVAHIPGKHMAKVVMVKLDGKLAIAVLPAHSHVNFMALQQLAHAKKIELAREYEFTTEFPHCDVGAMPPFGDLYGMSVYLADSLRKQDWIVFNGGNHSDLLRMSAEDYLTIAHPTLIPNC
ncbi:MAG: YbaK/EbsC family protein [Gammaproteobacteria bacterium]